MIHFLRYGGVFDLDKKLNELEKLKEKYNLPDFWNNQKESERVTLEINSLNELIKPMLKLKIILIF
jgi:hypothetical protein